MSPPRCGVRLWCYWRIRQPLAHHMAGPAYACEIWSLADDAWSFPPPSLPSCRIPMPPSPTILLLLPGGCAGEVTALRETVVRLQKQVRRRDVVQRNHPSCSRPWVAPHPPVWHSLTFACCGAQQQGLKRPARSSPSDAGLQPTPPCVLACCRPTPQLRCPARLRPRRSRQPRPASCSTSASRCVEVGGGLTQETVFCPGMLGLKYGGRCAGWVGGGERRKGYAVQCWDRSVCVWGGGEGEGGEGKLGRAAWPRHGHIRRWRSYSCTPIHAAGATACPAVLSCAQELAQARQLVSERDNKLSQLQGESPARGRLGGRGAWVTSAPALHVRYVGQNHRALSIKVLLRFGPSLSHPVQTPPLPPPPTPRRVCSPA